MHDGDIRIVNFFFQAEDGIRDVAVTGVQTVCSSDLKSLFGAFGDAATSTRKTTWRLSVPNLRKIIRGCTASVPASSAQGLDPKTGNRSAFLHRQRSEERRVGKECRSGVVG